MSSSIPKKIKWTLLSIAVVLVCIRIALPFIVENYVNNTLKQLDGYEGSIQDVDMALYRGAYVIEDIELNKLDEEVPVPFLKMEDLDISLQWKALLNGEIVAEIYFEDPVLNFVAETEGNTESVQTGEDENWQQIVKDLVPISINKLNINNGVVHYRDFSAQPEVDIYMSEMNAEILNLTNAKHLEDSMVSSGKLSALVMNSANLEINADFDPFDSKGKFDIDAKMEKLPLKELNNFTEAYAGIDAESGNFSFYAEVAADSGLAKGYIKPLIKNAKLVNLNEDGNFLETVWEGVVALGVKIVQNARKDQVASKIPFEGSLEDPDIKSWKTIGVLFKNAYIEALKPHIDGEIDATSITEANINK